MNLRRSSITVSSAFCARRVPPFNFPLAIRRSYVDSGVLTQESLDRLMKDYVEAV
ncbi:MAG: hypothetical protein ACYCOU_02370 [Sulfobacillus sp.]